MDKSHKAKYAFWDFPLVLVGPEQSASLFYLSSCASLSLEVTMDKSHKAKYAFWDFPLVLVGPEQSASLFYE
jgi:hypothetical protein